jgi:hypothetical protein
MVSCPALVDDLPAGWETLSFYQVWCAPSLSHHFFIASFHDHQAPALRVPALHLLVTETLTIQRPVGK